MLSKDVITTTYREATREVVATWYGKFFLNPFFKLLNGEPVRTDIILHGNEVIPASIDIRVIHTPGHTPGSICFHIPSKGVMVVGDALQNKNNCLSPPSQIVTENSAGAVKSISKLIPFDYDIVCFNHFRPIKTNGRKEIMKLASRYEIGWE